MSYAELHCISNFSFLRGASRPEELVESAWQAGYRALAITDECSLAGVVRAHGKLKEIRSSLQGSLQGSDNENNSFKLIIGSEFRLEHGFRLVVLAQTFSGYRSLCTVISQARRAADKGEYSITQQELSQADFRHCALILVPPYPATGNSPDSDPDSGPALDSGPGNDTVLGWYQQLAQSAGTGHLALELHFQQHDTEHFHHVMHYGNQWQLPVVACGDVHMHEKKRRALQDVVTCIRHHCTLDEAGRRLFPNGEHYLRSLDSLQSIYPQSALDETLKVAASCHFCLSELDYQYPDEVVPAGLSAADHLRALTAEGIAWRWPNGTGAALAEQIDHELALICDMSYEHYFLTVYDIVNFARQQGILCQGRGSAANSAVCFCLGITEVDPSRTSMLFERFISRERNEPPDIDVDFEHERREEVIQYIYDKYGRDRAAIAATVVSYRKRSAIRDIGKVLGLQQEQIDLLSQSLAWWEGTEVVGERLQEMGFDGGSALLKRFAWLLEQILGFPRHLSQHVGGFVIANDTLATLVPVENAAMDDRTIIQWDKDDLEELGLLKVDVLALGMLTAIRKCFDLIADYRGVCHSMASIPPNDTPTYDMICKADTMGVFQIESRAQMSMLPRLRPRNYYDLVIEVAIVRPGPIQGGMVNPYLKRRQGIEPVTYPNSALKRVLKRTLGVPVFQEQVMEIAMVAAGFSPGQADQLRRSMAAWRRVGAVTRFRDQLIQGMLDKGYDQAFAESIFRQIEGFGEYGFPESHAASFALLVYVSCWLKCHEPAAFLCAMLNSQPLGFYDASDLTQDARRHGVEVLPVDVNSSDWDHQLVALDRPLIDSPDQQPDQPPSQPAVRLGLRLVRGLSRSGADRLLEARAQNCATQNCAARNCATRNCATQNCATQEHTQNCDQDQNQSQNRKQSPFLNAADLVRRSGINKSDQQALAVAGALASISGNRHQAQWDLLGIEQLPALLRDASANEPQLALPLPTEGEDIVADYMGTGLTLGRHPLALLREQLTQRRILRSRLWLQRVSNGRYARLAGIVKVRQRPGSASGVVFVTLEDEDGQMNVIVWPDIVESHRNEVLRGQMLEIFGHTQREGDVVHLIARRIVDLSWMLGALSTHSRDFH